MTSSKKILIAAGGSGGHIYPAMGVAAKLRESLPSLEILFAAGGLLESPFFDREAFAGTSISSAPLIKKNPLHLMRNCGVIAKGVWESHRLLAAFKPDLVIGFGSYHTFPVLSAARLQRYPIVLHEQNSKPGKVIRLFSKKAIMTGVYFPSAVKALRGESSLMAMPLRAGFARDLCSREQAIAYFNLDTNKPTVLTFGGSQGARFINQTIAQELIKTFEKGTDFQLLHFTGDVAEAERLRSLYECAGIRSVVRPLESRMDLAWRVADLAIVRAGAGTIAEQIEFEVPAIFIPFPFAADGHQDSNADFVVDQVGGGWKFLESDCCPNHFSVILHQLLGINSTLLTDKKHSLAAYKRKASREEFTCLIQNLLETT